MNIYIYTVSIRRALYQKPSSLNGGEINIEYTGVVIHPAGDTVQETKNVMKRQYYVFLQPNGAIS